MATIKINDDIFNICKRIKNIDRGYFIEFDNQINKFLLKHNLDKNYFLIIPYEFIDVRTIEFIYKTMSKNLDFYKMQKENEDFEEKSFNELSYKARHLLKEKLSYAEGRGDVDFN